MNRSSCRALVLATSLWLAAPALAATTTTPFALSTTAYTDLGAGPILLGAYGGSVQYRIDDSLPAANAPAIGSVQLGAPPVALWGVTAHVWARAATAGVSAMVTAGSGVVGFGGGGGGGGPATIVDGGDVTQGAKADAKSTATDTTPVTIMQVMKEISAMVQAPASTPVTGTFWQATQPMSAASLPLPSGAATSAKQPALGAAGTPSADVLSVQGAASMTALKVDGSGVTQPVSIATAPALVTGTATIGNVGQVYPAGSTPITASATGTTGATTATLAANASLKTWICGFSIRANATAAATGNATVTGVVTATMNFTQWTAPLASGLGVTEEVFTPCIQSSATNTGIAVISAAPGTGGVVSVSAWGFQL